MNEVIDVLTLIVVIAVLPVILYYLLRKRIDEVFSQLAQLREEIGAPSADADSTALPKGFSVHDRLQGALNRLNCSPTEASDGSGSLFGNFQGETFGFHFAQNSAYVQIVDYNWHSQSLEDIEELSVLKTAINRANQRVATNLFYVLDKEENTVNVFSSKEIVVIAQMTPDDFCLYLQAQFREMLAAHGLLLEEMNNVRKGA